MFLVYLIGGIFIGWGIRDIVFLAYKLSAEKRRKEWLRLHG